MPKVSVQELRDIQYHKKYQIMYARGELFTKNYIIPVYSIPECNVLISSFVNSCKHTSASKIVKLEKMGDFFLVHNIESQKITMDKILVIGGVRKLLYTSINL